MEMSRSKNESMEATLTSPHGVNINITHASFSASVSLTSAVLKTGLMHVERPRAHAGFNS